MESKPGRETVTKDALSSPQILTRRQFWFVLSVSLVGFFFAAGPVWKNAFAIDTHVFASYVIIPVLVAGLSLSRRRFRWWPFVGVTFEIALLKFFFTLAVAGLLWSFQDPPARAPLSFESSPSIRAPREPTKLSKQSLGLIQGTLTPVAGDVWVYVKDEFPDFVFAPPQEPALLRYQENLIRPGRIVVHEYQDLLFVSETEGLHVLEARELDGRHVFNLPMLTRPPTAPVKRYKKKGVYRLRCRVHEDKQGETAEVLVVPHPFFAPVAADGRFRIENIPRGSWNVAVFGDSKIKPVRVDVGESVTEVVLEGHLRVP